MATLRDSSEKLSAWLKENKTTIAIGAGACTIGVAAAGWVSWRNRVYSRAELAEATTEATEHNNNDAMWKLYQKGEAWGLPKTSREVCLRCWSA